MLMKVNDAVKFLKKKGHKVSYDSIMRYVRGDTRMGVMEHEKNIRGETVVDPETVIAYKKTLKKTGRPKVPRREFKFDWEKFYAKLAKEGKQLKQWLEENNFKRSRLYTIRAGDTYPTLEEEKKLRSI